MYIDTLRADELPCWGYTYDTMPNVCHFAENAASFKNAYSQSSWTLPVNMSIITSLYPSQHNMLRAYIDSLDPSIVTMPQTFQANGYYTVFVGQLDNPHLPIDKGLGRGFDEKIKYETIDDWHKGLSILEKNNAKGIPSFLYMHTYYVHDSWKAAETDSLDFHFAGEMSNPYHYDPQRFNKTIWDTATAYLEYNPADVQGGTEYGKLGKDLESAKNVNAAKIIFDQLPDNTKSIIRDLSITKELDPTNLKLMQYLRNYYDDSLFTLDRQIGIWLEELKQKGLLQNTIVVIAGGNGEAFGEHDVLGHAKNLYDTVTHVPLIYYFPNIQPQTRYELTQSIDIYPTLCGLTGIKCPVNISGSNFAKSLMGNYYDNQNTGLVSEFGDQSELKSIRNLRWKFYINEQTKDKELYDVLLDKGERTNLIQKYPQIADHMEQMLYYTLSTKSNLPIFALPPIPVQIPTLK